MSIISLNLKNFRNYQDQGLNFHPRFNFIIGQNAQGKTNLLEAIFYLSHLSSFRSQSRKDLLFRGSDKAVVQGSLENDRCYHDIRIDLEPGHRKVQLNGKKPNIFREYFGLLPILLFEPKDVYLFRESPSYRRRFLNRALFLDRPAELKNLRDYNEVLVQKNRLLKEGDTKRLNEELPVWHEQLATLGSTQVALRLEWIDKINQLLTSEYRGLSTGNEEMRIEYQCTIPFERKGGGVISKEEIYKAFSETIKEREAEELRRRESLVGPHRDDWVAYLDERPIGILGSQGENRSAVIALKSAQIHLFEKEHKFPPIYLLDDVTSELDKNRTEALFPYFQETKGQVFLTATEPTSLYNRFKKNGSSFLIEGGKARVLG